MKNLFAIVATGIKWLYELWKKRQTPQAQRDAREKQIASDIAGKDDAAATLHGSSDLDRLDELHNRKNR